MREAVVIRYCTAYWYQYDGYVCVHVLHIVHRWALFTKQVLGNITDLDKFDGTDWLQQIGLPWSNDTTAFPTKPVGDTVEIASALFDKYIK